MHKCGKKGCYNEIDDKYRFCFEHKDTPYKDICRIHGKQTFINYQCQRCKELKKGIYRIYKRDKKYYFNKNKKPIDRNSKYYFLKPWFDILTHKTRQFHEKQAKSITANPGIYGIFLRDRTKKNQLGNCLYIGQSINVKNRCAQHKKNVVIASNHIKGVRAKAKKNYKDWKRMIPREKRKVENKYYSIAQYYLSDIKFVQLMKIEKKDWEKLSDEQRKILLCMGEQLCLDVFSPKTNTFASRPSYK